MKFIILILSVLTLLFFACNTTKNKPPTETIVEDNGIWNPQLHDIWVLTDLNGQSMENISKRPRLELFPADNRLGGHGSCNSLFGNIKATAQTIHFTELGSTKMYCADESAREAEFLKTLTQVNQYQIKGLRLYLSIDEKVVLIFQKID